MKLIINQSLIFPITLLISFVKSVGLWLVTIILVPSANKTGLDILDTVFGRSFMYRRKTKDPELNPMEHLA